MKLIDGNLVRDERKIKLIEKVNKLDKKLTLVDVNVGFDEASKIYIKQKEKMALSIGYNFINLHFDTISEDDLINEIDKLNKDPNITGIIVQLPLPDYLDKDKILDTISPLKDVDGLTSINLLKLINKENCLLPCTPKGIISLLDYYNIDLHQNVVVVGRSKLVGFPLFNMLLNRDATVTICHSKTKNLGDITKTADILIVAVGKKGLITKDMIKDNVIIIDVGINRVDDKIYGDVDENCSDKALYMTPVPGGVGPMTVISLMENVYEAYIKGLENGIR